LRLRDVIAGLLLGTVNYGSVYFLVKAYDSELMSKSTLLPVNNLAVVILGTLAAVFLFREKLNRINFLGVACSVVALALLLFGELIFSFQLPS
jgi:drug/metabolite transporter (DMT)-like permease